MKIAIYADEINRRGEAGVKTYTREIIKSLLKVDEKNDYTLYSRENLADKLPPCRAKMVHAEPKRPFWVFSVFAPLIRQDCPDVVFMPIQTFPLFIFGKNKPKVVVTVHDVAFRFFPDHFTFWRRLMLRLHTYRSVTCSDRVIVPSEATKKDLLRLYHVPEDKIEVIYHGVSRELCNLGRKNDPRINGLSRNCPYILFVGSIQPRKNIIRLVKAFDMLKKKGNYPHKLIICGGKGWMYWKIFNAIKNAAFQEDIIVVGDADNDLLSCLYADATLLVMPSLYEGFGLPVLEAMSFGTPVICADNSSLSEIAGDAALLIDCLSIEDIEEKMEKVLDQHQLQNTLAEKGRLRVKDFSWENAARKTLEVLETA